MILVAGNRIFLFDFVLRFLVKSEEEVGSEERIEARLRA